MLIGQKFVIFLLHTLKEMCSHYPTKLLGQKSTRLLVENWPGYWSSIDKTSCFIKTEVVLNRLGLITRFLLRTVQNGVGLFVENWFALFEDKWLAHFVGTWLVSNILVGDFEFPDARFFS